jgi:hypothetical protein
VKPTLVNGFDYKKVQWADLQVSIDIEVTVEIETMRARDSGTLAPAQKALAVA